MSATRKYRPAWDEIIYRRHEDGELLRLVAKPDTSEPNVLQWFVKVDDPDRACWHTLSEVTAMP